ncbi:hypothetical protein [Labedaea rhizosphaerae]|uniref:Uncharacterized protein n=1 Tax=Labedaea rhizosphaerae TaxID=598644 RepID=A0A4R6S3U8_LABRH|nr:hypothetical protein [Labedaea rhizosphaerae]TDP93894.1 hypothetical protein EV186_106288 [Labedaea rhizosphaerae]
MAVRARDTVPFYRERCPVGGLAGPVRSAELAGRLHLLTPFARPFDPAEEPTLWTGVPADLGAALRTAIGASRRTPVIEGRRSWVHWQTLGRAGAPYAAVLTGAVPHTDLDERARLLAADGRAVLVAGPTELAEVGTRIGHRGPVVARVSAEQAQHWRGGAAVVFDRHLGYYAALGGCARWHLSWRRFHAVVGREGLQVTALRRTRPTLVRVIPEHPGFRAVTWCPAHGTPVLQP